MAIRNRSTHALTDRSRAELPSTTFQESKEGYIILPYIYTTPSLVPLRTRFRASRSNNQPSAISQEVFSNTDRIYLSPEISKPSLALSRQEINIAPRYPHIKLPRIEHKITPHRTQPKRQSIYISGSLKNLTEDVDLMYARTIASHNYLPNYLDNKMRSSLKDIKRNASMPVLRESHEEMDRMDKRTDDNVSSMIIEISVEDSSIVQQTHNDFPKKVNVVKLYPDVSTIHSNYLDEVKAKFPMISFDEYAVMNRNKSIQTSFVNQIDEKEKDLLIKEIFDEEKNRTEIFFSLRKEERNKIIQKFLQDLMRGKFKNKENAKKFVDKQLEKGALESSNQEAAFMYMKMKAESEILASKLNEQTQNIRIETKLSDVKSRYRSINLNKTSISLKRSKLSMSSKLEKARLKTPGFKADSPTDSQRSKTYETIRIPSPVINVNRLDSIEISETDHDLEAIKCRRMSYSEGDIFLHPSASSREEAITSIKQIYSLLFDKLDKQLENIPTLPNTENLKRFNQANTVPISSENAGKKIVHSVYIKNNSARNNRFEKLLNTQQGVYPLPLKEFKALEVSSSPIKDLKQTRRSSKSQDTKRNRLSNEENSKHVQDIREFASNLSLSKLESKSIEIRIKSAEQHTRSELYSRSRSNEINSKKLTKDPKNLRSKTQSKTQSKTRSKTKPQLDEDLLELEKIRAAKFEAIMLKKEDQIKSLQEYLQAEETRKTEQEANRSINASLEEIPEQPSQTSFLSISPSCTPKESQQQSFIQNNAQSGRRTSKKHEKESDRSVKMSSKESSDESSQSNEDFDIYDYASKTSYQKFVFNFSKTLEKTILLFILAKKQAENKLRIANTRPKKKIATEIQNQEKNRQKRRNVMFDDRRGNIVLKGRGIAEPNQTYEESLADSDSMYKSTQDKAQGFVNPAKDTFKGKLAAKSNSSQYFTKRDSNEALLKKSKFLSQMQSQHRRQLELDEDDSGGFGSDTDSYEYEENEEEQPKKLNTDELNKFNKRDSMIAYELKYFKLIKSLTSAILGPENSSALVQLDEIPKDIYKDVKLEDLYIEDEEISIKLKSMLTKMQKFDGYIFSPNIIYALPRAAEYLKHSKNVNEIDFSSYEIDAQVYESISLKKRFQQHSKILPNYDTILERQRNQLYNTSIKQPRPDDSVKDRIKEIHVKRQREKIHETRGNQPAVIYGLRPIKSFTNLDLRTTSIGAKPINKRFKSKTNEYEEFVLSKYRDSVELSIYKENPLMKSFKSIHELSTSRVIHHQKGKVYSGRSSSMLTSAVHRSMGVFSSIMKSSRI